MILNDILTAHADAFRQKTGVSSKLTIADMTRMLDDLSWSKTNLLKGTKREYTLLDGQPNPIQIKNERLYEGTEPGIWTPNPSDLTGGGAELVILQVLCFLSTLIDWR